MNVWFFTGNLGQDASKKVLPSGTSVLEFSVAVRSGWGEKEKTTWANCQIFGKRAEGKLGEMLVKGAKVAVTGEATLEEWESKGVPHAKFRVSVNDIEVLTRSEKKAETATLSTGAQIPSDFDDDIPF